MSVHGRRKVDLLEEVRELEERLEHLSAATAEGVFVHDSGRILYLNQSGASMYGFEPEELLNRDVLSLAPPECRSAILERIAAGWEKPYETIGLRRDGTTFPVELHARNVKVGGKMIRAVTVRDLTQRRDSERELRESQERYRSILENLHAVSYRIRVADCRLLFIAGSVSEILGRDPVQLLSGATKWEDMVHPDDRGVPKAAFTSLGLDPGKFDFTYRIVRPEGTVVWVRDMSRASRVGSEMVLDGLVVDVTLAKATEQELRMTRDVLLRTEQLARIGSWSWEPESNRTIWSPGMYRHYGLTPAEPASPTEIALQAIHPEDLPRLRQHMLAARETKNLEPIEYRVRVKGEIRHHRTEGEVHRDSVTGAVRMVGFVQDVTALREIEEDRLRAEAERDSLFDISMDLLSVSGFDGWFKQLNPAWTRTLGWSIEELLSRRARDFVHPDDYDATIEAGNRLRRGEPVTNFENRYRHKDGSYRWLSWNSRSLLDAGLMFSVTRDVTREKAAREALESEVSFRNSIVKGAAEGLAVCHEIPEFPYVAFTVWNDRMTEMTGYDMEEINRLGWYQTVYPDAEIRERAIARMNRMRQGDDLHGEEWVITTKGGEKRVVRISTSVLRTPDDGVHVLALMDDVTERRRAEEALRESEERYRSLFEGAPYGIYRATTEGRLVAVNQTLAAMLGYAPRELEGRNVRDLHQDPAEWNRILASGGNGKPFQAAEVVWVRKDGAALTLRLTGRPLIGEDGLPLGHEMIAEDVTERRLLEEQFRQAQKMEAVGRLAGGIAHDFNNLLTAVSGYADLLRVRMPLDDPRRGYVEEIAGAADRAASLTRQLLAFSRRQILQPKVVNLEEMVRNVERMLGRIIGEDIELETRLAARGCVRADVSQLEQVLLNLAVNARDAMPEGGKLLIETEDAEVRADGEVHRPGRGPMPRGSYVLLAVSDTGIGMDRRALSHIFEPFFTTKEAGKGTGLGLATVYGIVKQSEGFIWVSSEPGRGARFEVYLPRVAGEPEGPRAAPPSELEGGSETVLLVEDEEGVRCIVSEMLEWYGYEVLRANGASEAVALARNHEGPIHLLLTDVVMPRLSGRALRDEISTHRPQIPVLYISGYAGEDRTRELLKDGAAFLAKPFTAAALAQKVREVLTGASLPLGPV
jgi:PAS domain S-box-containing protein